MVFVAEKEKVVIWFLNIQMGAERLFLFIIVRYEKAP